MKHVRQLHYAEIISELNNSASVLGYAKEGTIYPILYLSLIHISAYTNRALESAGRPERIDHRSYKRQGVNKIPSVHLGPAASQMEKR